jgi:peptide/nickel transport system substrate-binding protein
MSTRSFFSKSLSLIFVIGLTVPLLFGCTPAAPAATTAPAATEAVTAAPAATEVVTAAPAATEAAAAAPAKKTFVFGRYMDAINPDPVMNDANADIWYMQQYYSGLLRFTPDLKVEPDLATKWDISPDGLTYTFYLRPGIKFSDGTPITAEDWQWSLERAADKNNGIWWFTFEAVKKITATDTTVVFELNQPYVPFIYTPAMFNAVVMPKKEVEAAGGWEKFMLKPVGSGPFIMKEWVKGDHMDLVRNPYYWETGKPILDEILIKYIADDNTRILALQKGDVDAINFPPFNRVTDLSKDPNLNVIQFKSTFTNFITLNDRVKPFDNIKVRQALSSAIDRDAMIKTINFGVGEPATTFRPKGSLYFNDTLPGWPYDVQKAKQLLTEAGYPNGFKTTLQISSGDNTALQIATMVQSFWKQVGVTLVIQPLESGLYNDNYYKNNFEIQLNSWTDDIPDPSESNTYALVYKSAESFHTGFNNPEVNQLSEDALKETDPAKRQADYFRMQEIYNEQVPFISLWYQPLLVMTRKGVENFNQTPLGTYIWRDLDKK